MRQRISDEDQYRQRCEALRGLMDDPDRWATLQLEIIDAFLLRERILPMAEIEKIQKRVTKDKQISPQVKKGLEIYGMMAKLMLLCEPTGNDVGPTCYVKLIDFRKLDRAAVFELKGSARQLVFRLATRPEAERRAAFRGMSLLSEEEQKIYEKARRLNSRRDTLKSLAQKILNKEKPGAGYSDRNVIRVVRSLATSESKDKSKSDGFNRDEYLRRSMLTSVNSFGSNHTTATQMLAEMQQSMNIAAVAQAAVAATAAYSSAALQAVGSFASLQSVARAIAPSVGQIMLGLHAMVAASLATEPDAEPDAKPAPLRLVQ